MKKILNTMSFLLTFMLTSCVNFAGTETSVWSGGLWMIPLITSIGSAIFFYFAYKSSTSGSVIQTTQGEEKSDKNVPIYKIGTFWYGVTCLMATLLIILNVISNR